MKDILEMYMILKQRQKIKLFITYGPLIILKINICVRLRFKVYTYMLKFKIYVDIIVVHSIINSNVQDVGDILLNKL